MITDNEDVLTEILLWLPAKSLIRFKLVCKQWFSLISDHRFSQLHTLNHHHNHRSSNPEPSFLLHLPTTSNYFYLQGKKWVPYHFTPTLIDPTICNFSNGLFLLQCRDAENTPENCYIYNPTTKQSRNILLNFHERFTIVLGLNLAFDPLKSPHYKIICVRATRRRSGGFFGNWWRCCQIEVYESETKTWNLCGEAFFAPRHVNFGHGVYWNDGIHWNGMFYDFHYKFLGEHPGIAAVHGHYLTSYFDGDYIESNGYFHCIVREDESVRVSELHRDYSEWSLKFRVNLDHDTGPFSVLSIIRRDSEEDSTLVAHQPGKILVYKFEEQSFEEVIDFSKEAFYKEDCTQFVSRCTFQFIETLAPA